LTLEGGLRHRRAVSETAEVSPLKRRVGALLLVAYITVVCVSGFAWPLGYGGASVWPFNRGWWMFHREDGFYYHLRFAVLYADGRRDEADPDRWFQWPASEATRRYDEVSRDRDTLRALVAYLCRKHNADAPPAERWRAVTVTDTGWRQTLGRRVSYRATPFGDLRINELLADEPCP